MPYPLLSSLYPPTPGGPFGLRPWRTWQPQGRSELGRLGLRLKLQTLMFFHESLKLLLQLADLRPKFLSLGALRGRFLFGLR